MGKKMIALVMAVMVVFNITGCSGSKDEGNIVYKGRYVEEEISHNGNISEFYTENNIPVFSPKSFLIWVYPNIPKIAIPKTENNLYANTFEPNIIFTIFNSI